MRKLLIPAVGLVVLTGAGGIAYAADSSSSPSATPSAQPSSAPAKHKRATLEQRALHGQFTVRKKGGYEVVDAQRGSITAVNPTSITVQSVDGFTATYAITPTTKIKDQGKDIPVSMLSNGEKAMVVADDNGGHPQALTIRCVHEPKSQPSSSSPSNPAPSPSST